MDRAAAAALRLPPVARLAFLLWAVALSLPAAAAPAAARALSPPPVRLALVGGPPVWWCPAQVLAPPPIRWSGAWAAADPVPPPIPSRSRHGRA